MDISLTWFDLSDVKVINKVYVIPRSRSFQGQTVFDFYWQVGGGRSTERHSCFSVFCTRVQRQNYLTNFNLIVEEKSATLPILLAIFFVHQTISTLRTEQLKVPFKWVLFQLWQLCRIKQYIQCYTLRQWFIIIFRV